MSGDLRDTQHVRCDCVPTLGPPHCHLCREADGAPTPWPCPHGGDPRMIRPDHPAVLAGLNGATRRERTRVEAYPDDLIVEMVATLEAAYPHLTSATEENIARLRDTPVGRALMAQAVQEDRAVRASAAKDDGPQVIHLPRSAEEALVSAVIRMNRSTQRDAARRTHGALGGEEA